MKLILVCESEKSYQFLCGKLEGFELLPHPSSIDELKAMVSLSKPAAAVIPEATAAVWVKEAKQHLVFNGIPVVNYKGTTTGLMNQLKAIALNGYSSSGNPSSTEDSFQWDLPVSDEKRDTPPEDLVTADSSSVPKFVGFKKFEEETLLENPQGNPVVFQLKGTVTIAVGGVGNRVGNTYTSLRIASYLASKGYSVACLERIDHNLSQPVFDELDPNSESKSTGSFRINKVDYYRQAGEEIYMRVLGRKYNYVVVDAGRIVSEQNHVPAGAADFTRADYQLLTIGSSDWDFKYFLSTLDRFSNMGWEGEWNVIVSLADQERFEDIVNTFTPSERKKLNLNFFHHQLKGDPFSLTNEISSEFSRMLSSVLPEQESRGFLSKIFGKR